MRAMVLEEIIVAVEHKCDVLTGVHATDSELNWNLLFLFICRNASLGEMLMHEFVSRLQESVVYYICRVRLGCQSMMRFKLMMFSEK